MADYSWIESNFYEWVEDDSFIWVEEFSTTLRQIVYDINYIYVTTVSGLTIYDFETSVVIAKVDYDQGFTAVWGNSTYLYLGTLGEGIKVLTKSEIYTIPEYVVNLTNNVFNLSGTYLPSSNVISFIHGEDDLLTVVTDVGIDVIHNYGNTFKSHFSSVNVTRCYLTLKRELYYLTADNVLFKANTILCDWDIYDTHSYGADFFGEELEIYDFVVTVNTSSSKNKNTIFVATSNGIFVIDETLGTFVHYVDIISGMSNKIIAVRTTKDASLDFGTMYITSTGVGASVIAYNLETKSTYDLYTATKTGGRANTVLLNSNIIASA